MNVVNKINDLLPRLDADGWRPIEEYEESYDVCLMKAKDGYEFLGDYSVAQSNIVNTFARTRIEHPTHFKPLDDPLPKEAAALLRECLERIEELNCCLDDLSECLDLANQDLLEGI